MRQYIRALLLASVAISFFSLAHADSAAERADGSNAFGFKLWRELAATSDQNAAISPISLQETFAMLYRGTGPEVGSEFAEVLNFDTREAVFDDGMTDLLKAVSSAAAESGTTLERSNRLWVANDFPLNTVFAENLKNRYGAETTPLNFFKQSEAARQTINAKIAEQTHERIKDLIPPGEVDKDTRLVLTNALYFLADWKNAFNPASTRKENFRLANGKETPVDTMVSTQYFPYIESDSYEAIALPYRGERFAMLWVVPKKRDGLKEVEASFEYSDLRKTVASLSIVQKTMLFLPKFSFMTETIPLRKQLQKLGMELTFKRNRFESFPRLYADTAKKHDRKPLLVSNLFHKAFIKVDEKGTEAAAASAASVARATSVEAVRELRIDHPSLFFIYETKTNAVLLMGHLMQP